MYYKVINILKTTFKLSLYDYILDGILLDKLAKKLHIHTLDLAKIIDILISIDILSMKDNLIQVNAEQQKTIHMLREKLLDSQDFSDLLLKALYKKNIYTNTVMELYGVSESVEKFREYCAMVTARELYKNKSDIILDIGGNRGSFASSICKVNSNAQVHIYDLPYMQELCEANITKQRLSDRVTFFSKNIITDSINSQYDAIIMSNILHLIPANSFDDVMLKVIRAIRPSGVLVLIDFFIEDNRTGPLDVMIRNLSWIGNDSFFNYSIKDMVDKLEPYGLKLKKRKSHKLNMAIFQNS